MKITEEILRRHAKGLCTKEEKAEVERWFQSNDLPDTALKKVNDEKEKSERIWSQVSQILPSMENRRNVWASGEYDEVPSSETENTCSNQSTINRMITTAKKYPYQIAASFLLVAMSYVAILQFKAPELYIVAVDGMGQKTLITNKKCDINFYNALHLLNEFDTPQTVICSGKKLVLEPHQKYYITKTKNSLLVKPVDRLRLDPSTPMKFSNFSVSCI
ncbi:MAG: hypothetical protein AAGI25_11770 [Bacteroidota bacterium]